MVLLKTVGRIYSVQQAADAIIVRQKSKPPGFTESLYTRQSFQEEFESAALKGATLSQLDVDVVLKYLERDVRVVVVEKNVRFHTDFISLICEV